MTEDLAALLENEDEDALFARIQEESLRHYREVELPRRALESKDEDGCDTSDIFVIPHNVSSRSETGHLFYEGTEAGAIGFHLAAGSSYIYPSNYPVRDYQANIVRSALFHNTLVSLPTGLGKTFIAAVVMYNYYRWFPQGKVVFMAPTRPLVSQQIRACHDIMAIPAEDTIEMTGTMNPNERIQFWKTKRVFFLTPQVLANDLRNKVCPALHFKCVVVDEAHRATKEYAYCQVIRMLEEAGAVFRVLALSATPGSNFKAVQEVVGNLHIAKLEIRDESSIDVAPYTYSKNIEPIIVKLTDHIDRIKEEFLSIFDRYVRNLKDAHLVTGNVNNMTKFQLLKSSEKIKTRIPYGMTKQQVGYLISDFAVSMSLAHALELLQTYGLQAFHHYLSSGDDDVKVKAAMTRLRQDPQLQELLQSVEKYLSSENGRKGWSHPKLEHLVRVLQQHFSAAQDSGICSKVIIFCQYRVVVSEVYNILKTSEPLIRPAMFIGQSSGNGKGGLPQKKQLEVMRNFQNGETNVLIATCVAEEGLDIGAVDLIILMEAHRSPVRFVQRLGRTGRHRSGRCVVLLTSGKEVQKFNDAMATRKSYTRNILQNPNLVDSLNENDPRMLPSHLPNPVQQLVHIRVKDDTTAGGKYKKQSDIRQVFNKKTGNKKSTEVSTFLNSDQIAEIKDEFQTLEFNFNTIPGVSNKYLWQRLMDSPMGCEELFLTTYSQLSEFNDWNSSLFPTYVLSHSTDSNMFSELLLLAEKIRDKDSTRTDINTQFVRETVKSNENISKKRKKKNNKNNNGTTKKMKQDKQAPSCSMDIRNCMAIASQKIKLSQDVSSTDNRDDIIVYEPHVIDLVSENEEPIEIEDDLVAYADKELYEEINRLHSLAQNNSVDVNNINSCVLKELSCLDTLCPKFLMSFDFPNIEDDDITLANIKNLNIENMFKSCTDREFVFEEYKINTDDLLSKYKVYNDNKDNFVPDILNSYENIKKATVFDKVHNTTLNKIQDTVNSMSSECSEPKSEREMLSEHWNECGIMDSNRHNKISVSDSKNENIRSEQTTSPLPTVNHSKRAMNLKLTENINDADDNLVPSIQKERLTKVKTIEEKNEIYIEEDGKIIDTEDIISHFISGEITCSKLKFNKECNQKKNSSLSPSLNWETRKLENDNKHFNEKRVYTEKGQVSPILTSGKKNIRKYESSTESPTSPVLSNRMSIQHNRSEKVDNKNSASLILSSKMSVNLKNSSSLQENRAQYSGLENDSENSKSPILSGTTRYVKRQMLKKNLFSNQNEVGLHSVSASYKTEDKMSPVNSSFVLNKSMTECCIKNKYKAADKFSSEMQINARSKSFLQVSSNVFKDSKTECRRVSSLTETCLPDIVGIDELFEDIDNNSDKAIKNIVSTGKESKETEFVRTIQKFNSQNAESENEFIFNFDDLFNDNISDSSLLHTIAAVSKDVTKDSSVNINQSVKTEKQSCTSPIILSKRINSQSTPRPSLNDFVNNSKLLLQCDSKKLPVIESGSETESDILGSPILRLVQGTRNASRCSTPIRNFSSQFPSQKPRKSSVLVPQQLSVGKENSTANSKQVEQIDYFQLDGGEDDNWSFSQLFDKNKGDEESMYTISQLVAKSCGLPTPEPSSKQQEESICEVHSEVSGKLKEEKLWPSKNIENHLVDCKISDSVVNKELSNLENKPNKNSVASRHSNTFQFDSDDDLFEGIDSKLLSTSGVVNMNRSINRSSTINRESVSSVTSTEKFEKSNTNEQSNYKKVPECKNNSFNGYIKNNVFSESPGLLRKANIYDEKENIHSKKNIFFSNSKANKNLSAVDTSKMIAECNYSKLDNDFHHDIPFKYCDNFNSHVTVKSPLKNCNNVGNVNNSYEIKPVLSSGWITTKSVSDLKRARSDDFTSDDSDASSVFVSIRKNVISERNARNVKKKIKKHPIDKNIIVNLANEFVVREAEVSINRTLSSDEENTSGLDDLDESFIDDLTQRPTTAADQSSINMQAKYLQSVRSPVRGKFKIPVLSNTALEMDVYSQMEKEDDGSYMNDSFCVDDTDMADEAEPSILEIAEQILEDRRTKKKKRRRVFMNLSSSGCEEEDVLLKNSVKKNESPCSDEHSFIVNRKRKRRVHAVLSDSESDTEIVNHKHLLSNSDSICNKNTLEQSKVPDEASSAVSSQNKSSELFYKPTLSKLLKSKLKR